MGQKQIAFEKTKHQQQGLTFSEISPKWAKRRENVKHYLFLCQLHGYDGILNLSMHQGV